jgi:DNA-binding transcriptional LysR family regulator
VIELRLIQHALTLGRVRHFARAAEELHVAQPSLSRNIAALEKAVGVRLFDRGKGGVQPTAYGRVLLERGADLVTREADLRREIQLLAGLEIGVLAVGAGPYPTEISVGNAVTRLLRAHPGLKVTLITAEPDEIVRKVLTGEYDVGVANPGVLGITPRLSFEPLAPHDVYFASRPGHPLTAMRELDLETVLRFPIVTTLFAGEAAAVVAAHEGAGSIDRETGNFAPAIHVNSLSLALRIARDSDALFPGTASMLSPDVETGRLVRLDFHIPAMRTNHGILTQRDRTHSPAARAFIETLKAVEKEVADSEGPRPAGALRKGNGRPPVRRAARTRKRGEP